MNGTAAPAPQPAATVPPPSNWTAAGSTPLVPPPAPPQVNAAQYPAGSVFAASADGVLHVFQAGTPQNVIDGVMQDYALKQSPGYQQGAATVNQASNNAVGQVALPIENGLTLGNADRMQGAAAAAGQYLSNTFGDTDTPPSQVYAGARDATAQILSNEAQSQPITSGALNFAGSLPYGAGAGKLVAAAPGVVAKVATALGTGAALGAGEGAGNDRADPMAGALIGGTIGAATAPLAAGAGLVGKGIYNAAKNTFAPGSLAASADARAQAYVAGLLASKGTTAAQIAADNPVPVAQGGKTLAEAIGQQGVGKAAALTRSSGVTGDLANVVLPERLNTIARSGRLMDLYNTATGVDPSTARTGIDALVTQGRADVNPAYAAIRSDPAPVQMTPEMQNLVQTDPHVQKAISTVLANTRAPAPGEAVPQNPAFWLRVQQQLGDSVEASPVTGKPLTNDHNFQVTSAASDLGAALKGAIPGYADAQDQAAQYMAPQAAFQRAQGMLFGNGAGKQPADVQALWDSAKTPSEQQAIQSAFADDLNAKANSSSGLQPSNLQASGVQQKLAIVHGPDAAQNIMRGAQQEAINTKTGERITPNVGAITSEVLNHGSDETNAQLMAMAKEVGGQMMAGEPKRGLTAAVWHGARILGGKMTATNDTAFNDALGKYLLSDASSFRRAAPAASPALGNSPLLLAAPQASQLAIPYLTQQPQQQDQQQ